MKLYKALSDLKGCKRRQSKKVKTIYLTRKNYTKKVPMMDINVNITLNLWKNE